MGRYGYKSPRAGEAGAEAGAQAPRGSRPAKIAPRTRWEHAQWPIGAPCSGGRLQAPVSCHGGLMIAPSLMAVLLFASPAAPTMWSGHSLQHAWDDAWRGLQDRHGRPDSTGTALQHTTNRGYPEYDLDRTVSTFRVGDERAWQATSNGARVWIQSLDEFTLTNAAELKLRTPMGPSSALGVRLDRYDDRDVHRELVRIDFEFERVADTPFTIGLRFFPRWEKEDSDAEVVIGAHLDQWGSARLRLFAFDVFINAAYALAESRDAALETKVWQEDWPLGAALEVSTVAFAGVRAEAYLGRVLEASTRYRAPGEPSFDHDRTHHAWLAGGLLEWRAPFAPLRLGGSALHVATSDRAVSTDGRTDEAVEETLSIQRAYLLAAAPHGVTIEASTRHRVVTSSRQLMGPSILRPEDAGLRTDHDESGWIHTLLVSWLNGPVGLELGLIRVDRDVRSDPDHDATANHRLMTRCLLQPTERLWIRFGVGWDLDGGDGVYDGGGMTLVSRF